MEGFLDFIRQNYMNAIVVFIAYVFLYVFLTYYWKYKDVINKRIKKIWGVLKGNVISIVYKIISNIQKVFWKMKFYLKKTKGQIIFLIFYTLYIGFFVFLVINERMQEADVAFKYIIFPLYFAIPILFKSTFEKLENLTNRIEENAGMKRKIKKGGSFATENEIKGTTKSIDLSQNTYCNSGIPIIYDGGKNAFVEDSESHSLIIGSTGCGKTRRLVLPLINTICRNSESFIVTDPKGELYSSVHNTLKDLDYEILVLNFRNPENGNSWNPLYLPYKYFCVGNIDKSVELLNDLGLSIFSTASSNDPFWENSAIDYFIGLSLALFEDAEDEKEVNFNSIYNMSIIGEQIIHSKSIIKRYFEQKDENSISSISVSGTLNAPNDTRGGILSVFRQKIRIFNANKRLSRMMSGSDFDISNIARKKTAIFIVIQDEKSTYHPLASAFLKQTYEELVSVSSMYSKGKLPIRINYVLDEFANLPKIADMDNIVTAARSRNIRLYLIIQGMKQLNSIYGDNVAEVIKGNCDYWYYMMSKELSLLQEISELCGTKSDEENNFLQSSSPLVSITDLQLLQVGEVLILQKRLPPYIAKLPDITKYIYFLHNEGHIEPTKKEKDEPHIFSIRHHICLSLIKDLYAEGLINDNDIEAVKDLTTEEFFDFINKVINEESKSK